MLKWLFFSILANNGFYKILPLCTFTPLDRVPLWARLFEFGLALTLGPILTRNWIYLLRKIDLGCHFGFRNWVFWSVPQFRNTGHVYLTL